MVPSEYRLERVVAGLIERLDGARRSYEDEASARVAFRRVADEQVDAAMAEWRGVNWNTDPDKHAAFVRREVHETFLPRFLRVALARNEAERNHFGFAPFVTPMARIFLVVCAVALLGIEVRLAYLRIVWPLFLVAFALPFLPDVVGWMADRRYDRQLTEILADMTRIQDQQLAWAADDVPASSALDRARQAAAAKDRQQP
jgi:hypothetical protein